MKKTAYIINPSGRATIAISIMLAMLWAMLYLMPPNLIDPLTSKWADLIVGQSPEIGATGKVVLIDIDERSLNALGQWPWPRWLLADLLEKITAMNAKAVALDFILAEPDRSAALSTNDPAPDHNGSSSESADRHAARRHPDRVLAETLSQGPYVLGYAFAFDQNDPKHDGCQLHPIVFDDKGSSGGRQDVLQPFQARGVVCNLSAFSRAAPFSGFLNGRSDPDGRIRRLPLIIAHGRSVYPNLALAALMAGTDNPPIGISRDHGGQPILNVGSRGIPVDETGSMYVRFSAQQSNLQHISAADILHDRIDAAMFEGRIVLIGPSASGLATKYATPGNGRYTAVELHAQAIETILSGNHIRRSKRLIPVEILLALVAALLMGFFACRFELVPVAAIGLAGIAICWGGAQLLFNLRQVLVSPLLPAATITLNALLLLLYKYWMRQHKARRELEEALVLMKSSKQDLNSIITTIPDIVFRLDATGHITFISPAVIRYNRKPTELIGCHILDLVSPEDRSKAIYHVNERRTGPRATTDLEIRLNFDTSDEAAADDLYFSVSAVGIYEELPVNAGTFMGTQGIARDISQRKQLEKQLKKAQKMEAIGSLAAGVAHDLNNILSGLVSYPELLLLDLPADSPMHAKIETIYKSGKRAADIVQDLLTIARRGVKDHGAVDVNQAIRTTLETIEFKQLQQANPKIRMDTDFDPDAMPINGSVIHISKVIMNLVRNAVEAMPAGGTIRICTTNRYLDTSRDGYEQIPEGEYVVTSVSDDGIGMDKDTLQSIFEPFYSNKRMGKSGSGLGMTIVWNTIKDHDGYMDIRSREGRGTCFELYLPALRNMERVEKSRVVLEDYTGSERILVVDDMAEQRNIAVAMLSRLGYQVNSVPSGEAALTCLQEAAVDLVVLDMVMPNGMDGLETYRHILEIQPKQKAIIASGYANSERVREMHHLGAGEYIRKPYTLEKIGLAVRKELDR